MKKGDLGKLREDYSKASLSKRDLDSDPMGQFGLWFQQAMDSEIQEPNAMTFATANPQGKPTCRVVLLKAFDEKGLVFYTNYKSDKAFHIQHNPYVACSFLWKELQRQVRIEGKIRKVDEKQSARYFKTRPRGSQIGAWSSEQSRVIENRGVLETQQKAIEKKFKNKKTLPIPENWGGYLIEPKTIEFWQGRQSRLHDRLKYELKGAKWEISRLSP